MKIELNRLAGYLPYGLRIDYGYSNPKNNTRYNFKLNGTNISKVLNFEEFRPILRPLSDLTKEIEVDGERFVPMKELVRIMHPSKEFRFLETSFSKNVQSVKYKYHSGRNTVCDTINIYTEELNGGSKYCFNIVNTDYWIIQKFYEWHFDIHGLLEKGLAIDKNTL
jgi:hypothetical protein